MSLISPYHVVTLASPRVTLFKPKALLGKPATIMTLQLQHYNHNKQKASTSTDHNSIMLILDLKSSINLDHPTSQLGQYIY